MEHFGSNRVHHLIILISQVWSILCIFKKNIPKDNAKGCKMPPKLYVIASDGNLQCRSSNSIGG